MTITIPPIILRLILTAIIIFVLMIVAGRYKDSPALRAIGYGFICLGISAFVAAVYWGVSQIVR